MFIIVRHGNTFEPGEPARRIGCRTDLPLTAQGVAQARALGQHFARQGWHFSRVLVSPLMRAQETAAQIVAAHKGERVVAEPAAMLDEIDHGPDEGAVEEAVLARIGAAALAAWDTQAAPPPGWIVNPDERLRAWRDLFAHGQPDQGPVLLVTSNGAARFALLADPALQQASARLPSLKLATGSYGVIAGTGAGGLDLRAWSVRP